MTRITKGLATASLIPLSVTLALVLAEALYRVIRLPALSPTSHPAYVRHDADLGWSHIPGSVSRHRTDEFDVRIAINSHGYRGPDWPRKDPEVLRVLLLGDSEAFGWGVDSERTFASLVSERRADWEVLNAAVSAYGTDQELLLLDRLLPPIDPDVVVCLFTSNDLFENASGVSYGRPKPWFTVQDGTITLQGQPVPYPPLDRISLLYRALRKNLWLRRHRRSHRDVQAEWKLTKALYRTMRDRLAGRPLVLVSDSDELGRFSRTESGIFHVDVRPFLARAEKPVRFAHDGHLNAEGHRRIAQALRARLPTFLEQRAGAETVTPRVGTGRAQLGSLPPP